jgi:formylmethanofuran dehydrogenase subunit E
LALAVISCGTVTRSVVLLPDVPGAKYIGSKECEQCHEEIYSEALPRRTTPG